jgi:hypothetical protein
MKKTFASGCKQKVLAFDEGGTKARWRQSAVGRRR